MKDWLRYHYPEIFGNQLWANLHIDPDKSTPKDEETDDVQKNEIEAAEEKGELNLHEKRVICVNSKGLLCRRGGGFV